MSFTTRPELHGTFGAVASTHWIASAVGMRILERGGNAFDAAVAVGFTLQVVEPHLNGPGGEVPILACRAGAAAPDVICGQGPAPRAATIDRFNALGLDLVPGTGQLPACVPGAFGAWLTLLRDYGTLPLADVLEPAIGYAGAGHPLAWRVPAAIRAVKSLFELHWRSSAAIYLPGGEVPETGALFRNRALATLYAAIVADAARVAGREQQIERALDYWYRGPVAEAIDRFAGVEVHDVTGRAHRGLLAGADLARWKPTIEAPMAVDYGRYRVFKCGPWSQGPVLLQMLQILAGFDLDGGDPLGPDFVHVLVEATKLAMADRDAWYGDDGDVPMAALLDPAYATARRALIGTDASDAVRPGSVDGRAPPRFPILEAGAAAGRGAGEPTVDRSGEAVISRGGAQRGDTCHVDVADRWGNLVAATPSGGWLQSSPVIPELGFGLTTRGQMFWLTPGLASSLAPGRRPRTTLTPTIAYRDGAPYLAFGTPGGDQQDQWSALLFLHHVHHAMNLQAAIDAPALHTDHLASSFWPRGFRRRAVTLEDRFPQATRDELARRGHQVVVADGWTEGRLSACATVAADGLRLVKAAANPRTMQGYALAR
ncbi:MAG: gamma-glutamyltransferase family protein [Alphaproteobacteria bacterium]|nr:gamma-glutamyltransferase family protein [Alphaproteobacteria bacterium]